MSNTIDRSVYSTAESARTAMAIAATTGDSLAIAQAELREARTLYRLSLLTGSDIATYFGIQYSGHSRPFSTGRYGGFFFLASDWVHHGFTPIIEVRHQYDHCTTDIIPSITITYGEVNIVPSVVKELEQFPDSKIEYQVADSRWRQGYSCSRFVGEYDMGTTTIYTVIRALRREFSAIAMD